MNSSGNSYSPSEDVLKVLFPGTEVPLGGGLSVTITPLCMEDLAKFVAAFAKIVDLAGKGATPADIVTGALTEVLQILPYCINLPVKAIPLKVAPHILELVVEQNLDEASLGKWKALFQRMLGDSFADRLVQGSPDSES